MKIAVIGRSGQLAQALAYVKKEFNEFDLKFIGKEELDITQEVAVDTFFKNHSFECIVNCSAYTAVDQAEDDYEGAYQLNVSAIANLRDQCLLYNRGLIHVSTDYVFDGSNTTPYKEIDTVNPSTVYGNTKVEGEALLLNSSVKGMILRTSWLYSPFGKNFYLTILGKLRNGDNLSVVKDQIGTPTSAIELARVILLLVPFIKNRTDVDLLHVSNTGKTSWHGFAEAIKSLAGLTNQIEPVNSDQFKTKAKRPSYSVLDSSRLNTTYDLYMKPWDESLKEVYDISQKIS